MGKDAKTIGIRQQRVEKMQASRSAHAHGGRPFNRRKDGAGTICSKKKTGIRPPPRQTVEETKQADAADTAQTNGLRLVKGDGCQAPNPLVGQGNLLLYHAMAVAVKPYIACSDVHNEAVVRQKRRQGTQHSLVKVDVCRALCKEFAVQSVG